EQRHFFAGGWMCVGLSADIPAPGDQRAETVGAGGVFMIRDSDGALRCFANACRHRGHELLPCGQTVNRTIVVCPYHAWSYKLDGSLRRAPNFEGGLSFDAAEHGLVELPSVEWHGYVFADSSGCAGPLDAHLDGLEALVAPYEPERLVIGGRHDYVVTANWKILSENYQECYHCPIIHPELCTVSPPQSGENYVHPGAGSWVGGWMELREGMKTMSLDGHTDGTVLRGVTGDAVRHVLYIGVFPNLLVSLHPDYVMTHRLTPVAADRTRVECMWAFSPEDTARPGFDPAYAIDFWDITNREDWMACESVQRGLSNTRAVPGPLSREEDAVYQFVTMVARGYSGLSRVANEAPVH
ncbi:MAG TPA: aromatic ring-hydroxylating dioxygenase subunit alpha, partial [Acidimicrobiales bacterium]|nr:aromatic ring-hydroxylating dioxygenase subunit alpha [Acidimicrobiales bacterium]